MSRLENQSSVDEHIAMYLQYGLSELTISDDVIAREIQEEYHNKLMCNDAAIALEFQQEEAAWVQSSLHDDEELARTLQDLEGDLQTSLSDDEKLARYLQQEDESGNSVDESIQEDHQFIPMQVNRSYIPQRDVPSTSRAFLHYDDGDNFLDHTHTRVSSYFSTNSSYNPPVNENIDPTNMTYEELDELEDSIGDVNRGLSQGRISRLPTHKYGSTTTKTWWWQKKKKFVANDSHCSICLVDYAKRDKIITLPCNHIYHKDCISQWLKQSKVCCVCKAEV